MSLLKTFGSLSIQTRSLANAAIKPKKFKSILANIPKKPQSAWQIYMSERMTNYKLPNGKVDLKMACVELGQSWRAMGEAEKKIYHDRYDVQVNAHNKSMQEALNNATQEEFKQENGLRKKYNLKSLKDPRQPKRNKNSFMLYLEHLRVTNDPAIASVKVTQQVSEAAKKYNALSEAQKNVYKDKAKALQQVFEKEMAEYKESAGLEKK